MKEEKRFDLLASVKSAREIIFEERDWMVDGPECEWDWQITPKQELVIRRW